MKRISVALVALGEQLPIVLETLAKRLNALQGTYLFTVETSIPSLGDPDEAYQWYHIERLITVVRNHHHANNYDYIMGLTRVRITTEKPDPIDMERDYFCLGDFSKCSVISLNDNLLGHLSPATNHLQYAAFTVASELMCGRARKDMYHETVERCLFDDCPDRKDISHAILNGDICVNCLSALKTASVGEKEVASVLKILKWCKRRTGAATLLARVTRHPLTSLTVGTIIGWLSSVYITEKNCLDAVLVVLIIPCGVALYYTEQDRRKRTLTES